MGISKRSYGRFENGEEAPLRKDRLNKFIEVTGVTLDQIIPDLKEKASLVQEAPAEYTGKNDINTIIEAIEGDNDLKNIVLNLIYYSKNLRKDIK